AAGHQIANFWKVMMIMVTYEHDHFLFRVGHFVCNDVQKVYGLLVWGVVDVVKVVANKDVPVGTEFPIDNLFPEWPSVDVSDDDCFQIWCFKW
ncbi:MAG: hypothetical protein RIR96_534, partial [Bacteroidota bacterium]